jgi:hypothetical protein
MQAALLPPTHIGAKIQWNPRTEFLQVDPNGTHESWSRIFEDADAATDLQDQRLNAGRLLQARTLTPTQLESQLFRMGDEHYFRSHGYFPEHPNKLRCPSVIVDTNLTLEDTLAAAENTKHPNGKSAMKAEDVLLRGYIKAAEAHRRMYVLKLQYLLEEIEQFEPITDEQTACMDEVQKLSLGMAAIFKSLFLWLPQHLGDKVNPSTSSPVKAGLFGPRDQHEALASANLTIARKAMFSPLRQVSKSPGKTGTRGDYTGKTYTAAEKKAYRKTQEAKRLKQATADKASPTKAATTPKKATVTPLKPKPTPTPVRTVKLATPASGASKRKREKEKQPTSNQ